MKTYNVWIEVEIEDSNPKAKQFEDVGLMYAATATFKKEDQAVAFANALNDVGKCMMEIIKPK